MNVVLGEFAIFFIFLRFCQMDFQETDNEGSNSDKYQPVYLVKSKQYVFVNSMAFDAKTQEYILLSPKGYYIEVACPKKDENGTILEIVDQPVTDTFPLGVQCDNLVKPHIEKISDSGLYAVGFLIDNEDGDFTRVDLDEDFQITYDLVTLMFVYFDGTEARPKSVWYKIIFGDWIQIEATEQINNSQYESNDDIYGFNVDEMYSLDHQTYVFELEFNKPLPCPLVKIQLAPADDFFLSNFKNASRVNINTAPIWENILPQWRSLESLVRKVAHILSKLTIITGTYDLQLFPASRDDGTTKLFYLHNDHQKLTVPKYFWKAVIFNKGKYHDPKQSYGILFIMLNDPYFHIRQHPDKQRCKNEINESGWDLYAKADEKTKLIYACRLTQENMNKLNGEKLPMQKYNMFNVQKILKSFHKDETN